MSFLNRTKGTCGGVYRGAGTKEFMTGVEEEQEDMLSEEFS
jgi:hypothetical protein